jgi:hypothetical protein
VNPPDLVHGTVDVSGGAVTFIIQFATGTFDRQSTRVTVQLDTDQNAATGIATTIGLGIDYALDMWAPTNQAKIQQAMPASCVGGGPCYADVASVALGFGVDSMTVTVPLSMLANQSGRLNYRVVSYTFPQPTVPTALADMMPDSNLAVAHVP